MESIKLVLAGQTHTKEYVMRISNELKDHCKGAYQPNVAKVRQGRLVVVPDSLSKEMNKRIMMKMLGQKGYR